MSYKCPKCNFKTPHAKSMDRHRSNTRHGEERKARKYTTLANGMIKKVK
jgi:hypothetical protein